MNLYRDRVRSWIRRLPSDGIAQLVHLAGKSRHDEVWLPGVEIGETQWNGVRGLVLDDERETGHDIDGVLGLRGLQIDRIYFDFENNTLSWV